jgi:hypothetical protein
MNIQTILNLVLGYLNFAPGLKTKFAAVAAFLLAIVAAWNSLAPQVGVDFIVTIPDWLNATVLALLGVGAANQPSNLPKP